jgi:multimeric flavodoxin WrbA
MNKLNNALLLVGSPKGKNSVSNNLATYVKGKFEQKGVKTQKVFIVKHMKEEKLKELVNEMDDFDLIVLLAPLYVDSLPSIVIKLMEEFYEHKTIKSDKVQKLMAVINSGFPEPHQNDLAVDICKNFAYKSNMEWVGGITIGMGPSLDNKPLEKTGGLSRNLRKGLDIAINALSENKEVPEEAFIMASKPLMPLFISKSAMCWFGGRMWKGMVKDKSVKKNMYYRPYES